MRPDAGGGGARILIDPDSLRTAAGRLKGIAGDLQMIETVLSDVGYPNMPPGTYGVVQPAVASSVYSISSELGLLTDAPTELTRRAFWAEYADRMMSGYVLTGTAKKEFEQWLADGTLLRYASPDEARAAGVELAKVSGDFRKDPRLLLTLAADLKGAETATDKDVRDAFSAGFVNQFGAKNMELVPRVIQAMESSSAIESMYSGRDLRSLDDVARAWEADGVTLEQLHVDPVKDLLAPFSIALANATASGQLTRTVEQDIANDDDEWATAALLSQGGKFGTPFLIDCFRSGVVQKIARDSPYYEVGSLEHVAGPEPYDLGSRSGDPLPADTKQIIMEALARNPQAAHQALTQSLADLELTVADGYGQRSPVDSPITLLYQYGHFGDSGAGLGHAFVSGERYAHEHEPQSASDMTLRLIDQVVNHGRDDMTPVQVSLAHTIADHYVGDLHLGADQGSNDPAYDPDHDGTPGGATANGMDLSRSQVTHLLSTLIADDDSRGQLMNGVVAYQTNLIHHGIAGNAPGWAHELGSFDGLLNTANASNAVSSVQAAQAQQAAISNVLDSVISLVPLPHGVDVLAGQVPDLIASHYGPHGPSATDQGIDFHDHLLDQLKASIVAGYVDAHPDVATSIPAAVQGMQGLPYPPTNFLDDQHHIIPWNKMSDYQQRTFVHWYSTHDQYAGSALQQASTGMGEHTGDQTGD